MTGKTLKKASSAQKISKTGAPKSLLAKKAAPAPEVSEPRAVTDWERIEVDYRAGIRSVREIAAEHRISHTAINKRASANQWARDLKAKIKAKADALVSRASVSKEVSAETKITEQVTVDVEAKVQARVRLAHRTDIGKARTLAMSLLRELEDQSINQDLYEQLAELLHDDKNEDGEVTAQAKDRQTKRLEVFRAAISLSGRSKTMKEMADTLKTLIGLEREAFGLSVEQKQEGTGFYESSLDLVSPQ